MRGVGRRDRLNLREPKVAPAPPDFDAPPRELQGDELACAEWTRVAPLLRQVGVLTIAERSCLIALCQQWSVYQTAHAVYRHSKCERSRRIALDALARVLRLWLELGLTPSARSKLTALVAGEPEKSGRWAGDL
jgi:P27 family predicted phage terminase small subunit